MRKNYLSRLPSGPPGDNYLLDNHETPRFSVPISRRLPQLAHEMFLSDFDADEYLPEPAMHLLGGLMEDSPIGRIVDLQNARAQYLFLRGSLRSRR
jgi:hypothetical protein